jgi:hypothetical protein
MGNSAVASSVVRAGAGVALAAGMVLAASSANAVTGTTDLTVQPATDVAQALVGPGVTISNVNYTGSDLAAGLFSGGASTVGFDTGVVMSSGDIADVVGPNTAENTGTDLGTSGDSDLDTFSGFTTYDASVLEFDFTPNADTVYFRYVFSSEEYQEYVNTEYNDTFAFFVNGTNYATVPDPAGPAGAVLPVSVNTVNNGNPGGDPTATNPALYVNNDLASGAPLNIEMDGLTVVLTFMAPVNNGVPNSMKLAIADASDGILDSAVFLEEGSLTTTPPSQAKVTGGGRLDDDDGRVTFGTVALNDDEGMRGNLQVNDHRSGDKFHGYSVTSISQTDTTATWTGEGRFNGEDGYTFEATVVDNRNGNSAKKGDPDTIEVTVYDSDSNVVWSTDGAQDLNRGNITVHPEE